MPRQYLTAAKLQPADVVNLGGMDAFSTATVKQVTDRDVTFFRPFVHTGDFEHTGGVSCYVGIEEFSIARVDNPRVLYEVLSRKELK